MTERVEALKSWTMRLKRNPLRGFVCGKLDGNDVGTSKKEVLSSCVQDLDSKNRCAGQSSTSDDQNGLERVCHNGPLA